jgi:biotin carboxylase
MTVPAAKSILCLASYFKGNRFLQRCKREGCRVYLLTLESLGNSPWARDHLDDVFLLPSFENRDQVIHSVAYLMRTRLIDRIVALDDYDVAIGAFLREHFRLPGQDQSTARFFHDKLAMRVKARQCGIAVPEFVGLIHHDFIRRFLGEVPGPWLMKPRSEASSIGIKKFHHADDVWRRIDELGDAGSFHLLERFVPSDLYHVDSLVAGGKVVFAEVGQYHRPLLELWNVGGVFGTRTAQRDRPEILAMKDLNAQILHEFGMEGGCSHTEFLRAKADCAIYFLETSARVGGACIADMVEAATGLNLWEEWARIEIAGAGDYILPPLRQEFAGATVSLARVERPDTASFSDPEVFFRLDQKHHIGLVVRSASSVRVEELLDDYMQRIARDFQAVLPPAETASVQ